MVLGGILVALGIIFLLNSLFGSFWFFRWGNIWPLILIGIGLVIILARRR